MDVWTTTLVPVLQAVLNEQADLAGRKEQMYRQVEHLVYLGFTDDMSKKISEIFHNFIYSQHVPESAILHAFSKFELSLKFIAKLFNALDRELIFTNDKGLVEMGMKIYHGWFCEHESFIEYLVTRVLTLVQQVRTTGIENPEVYEIFNLAVKVDIYDSYFAQVFTQHSIQWYHESSESVIPLCEYMAFTEQVLQREEKLASVLPVDTWKVLESHIKNSFIKMHFPALITKHLHSMILDHDLPNLKKLFHLANLLDDQIIVESVLKHEWIQSIQKWTTNCLETETGVIEKLLLVKKNCEQILRDCLESRKSFQLSFKESIEGVLNATRVPVSVFLAEAVDAKFRSFIENVDGTFPDLHAEMGLFKHISSKDIFEVHFRILLARRLIWTNFSKLSDIVFPREQEFILQLKSECGPGFTNKCECMVKDAYIDFSHGSQFHACVLTSGVWPKCIAGNDYSGSLIPKIVQKWELNFIEEYRSKFPMKLIKFNYGLSEVIVRYNRTDWVCSVCQVLILLLFDAADSMSVDVITRELVGLHAAEVSEALDAIYKAGILVLQGNIVSLNPKLPTMKSPTRINKYQFESSRRGNASGRMSEQEREAAEATVMEDRQHQLDAALIRAMKQQKSCSVAFLVEQVQTAIFSQSEIKRRIASLVDREFLQQNEQELVYLA